MEEKIRQIIEGYKGAKLTRLSCGRYSSDYVMLVAEGMKHRNMPYAAKKILEAFPEVKWVHFAKNGFTEHVYSRKTLSWIGFKFAE